MIMCMCIYIYIHMIVHAAPCIDMFVDAMYVQAYIDRERERDHACMRVYTYVYIYMIYNIHCTCIYIYTYRTNSSLYTQCIQQKNNTKRCSQNMDWHICDPGRWFASLDLFGGSAK